MIHNGFKIIRRNYRCKIGEIDIIAEKDDIIRFIEVKYRSSLEFGTASQSITSGKQRKILRTAWWYIIENNLPMSQKYSFDVIAIQGTDIEYICNCFGVM